MSIQLLFFAQSARWMGESHLAVDLCGAATLEQLLREHKRPLAPVIARLKVLRIAVNQRFADLQTPLRDGDEVAFLPPVSGG